MSHDKDLHDVMHDAMGFAMMDDIMNSQNTYSWRSSTTKQTIFDAIGQFLCVLIAFGIVWAIFHFS